MVLCADDGKTFAHAVDCLSIVENLIRLLHAVTDPIGSEHRKLFTGEQSSLHPIALHSIKFLLSALSNKVAKKTICGALSIVCGSNN